MVKIIGFIVGLYSLLGVVRPQCLSPNDDLSSAEDTDLSAIQDFHFDLFKRVIPDHPSRNFIFSPYSIWNSLVLAYFGSRGETQRQFEEVLRVKDKISTLRKWRQLEYMYTRRPETSVNNSFVLANHIYFDSSVRIRLCVEDILHNEVQTLKLLDDPKGSADIINKFVSETTRGHIDQLVSPTDIMFAHMVLVNAAFFKGFWSFPFEAEETRSMPFRKFNSQTVQVPMMNQYGLFNYAIDDKLKYEVLELPYVGDIIFMNIFLPLTEKKENFNSMLQSLTSSSVNTLLESMWKTKMHIYVPRFSLDSILEEDMLQAIHSMGLKDAFVVNKANFSDFSLNKFLKLDHGIHKAFIEVNEEGTEAGAATAFIAYKIGGSSRFKCDRPFVFLIRDAQTKNVLFMGAFKEPKISGVRGSGLSGTDLKPPSFGIPNVESQRNESPKFTEKPILDKGIISPFNNENEAPGSQSEVTLDRNSINRGKPSIVNLTYDSGSGIASPSLENPKSGTDSLPSQTRGDTNQELPRVKLTKTGDNINIDTDAREIYSSPPFLQPPSKNPFSFPFFRRYPPTEDRDEAAKA